jgi:hypothetical protein
MKTQRPALCRLVLAITMLWLTALAQAAPAANDESDLPESLRSGYVGPVIGPADNRAYARGTLGLVRPSFGRASLFVAWRVMHLPVGALAQESHRRQGDWLNGAAAPAPASASASRQDEIEAWMAARSALVTQAPRVAPDYFRTRKIEVAGFGKMDSTEGQCGPDAFALATRTLRELAADPALTEADRRNWVTGQDAVFARCSWLPGTGPLPAMPNAAPANAPTTLKTLNAYQRAAALFYADEFTAAREAFDTIAATSGHPLRAWATLGALRCVLRSAVRDAQWQAALDDAWTKRQLRGAAFRTAMAEPVARHRARVQAALKDFEQRSKLALADTSIAPAHAAIRYTERRALLQLAPLIPLGQAINALNRPETNPYTMGALDLVQELFPRVAGERPEGPLAEAMRQHPWLDFVITVQACTDLPQKMDAATCDSEHAHALARWQESKDTAWLLATLMTARQPSAADLPAALAALNLPAERPEWASLQFYAARVLRAHGRSAEARTALDTLARSAIIHKRDRPWLEIERRGI